MIKRIAYDQSFSRFRRIIYMPQGITLPDTIGIAATIQAAGYSVDMQGLKLTSPTVKLDVVAGKKEAWIETRRISDLDEYVDLGFLRLLQSHSDSECRCSDCYACCSTSDTWLEIPQESKSCQFSQRRKPSPHFVRTELPTEPLFIGQKPRR